MTDWKTQQMIKASGWPLAPEDLAPGADFNARLADGLVPLHWACAQGKQGLVQYLLDHGANVLDTTAGAPAPTTALRAQLTHTFSTAHTNAKNRLQQTLRDWDKLSKKA